MSPRLAPLKAERSPQTSSTISSRCTSKWSNDPPKSTYKALNSLICFLRWIDPCSNTYSTYNNSNWDYFPFVLYTLTLYVSWKNQFWLEHVQMIFPSFLCNIIWSSFTRSTFDCASMFCIPPPRFSLFALRRSHLFQPSRIFSHPPTTYSWPSHNLYYNHLHTNNVSCVPASIL